jgi:prepilin-type N-terminal cleavage/methylation domain-containing protein
MRGKRSRFIVFNQRGFTLIELMMVIAILSVLSTIGFRAYTDNRKQAADAQVVSLVRSVLTYAAVDEPSGEQASTENKPNLTQVGYPEVDLTDLIEFDIVNAPGDMWKFTFAHAGGKTGYYFWIPGDACGVTTDGDGYPSDAIQEDPAFRGLLGL